MPKLLILSRYDRQGASSRLRMLQYIPYLEAAGFEVEVSSFFDQAYLRQLYAGGRSATRTLDYFRVRVARLRNGAPPDLIWLEKEALPWCPWTLERRLLPGDVPLVSDYDDAVFHRYDRHRNPAVRRLLGSKIDGVMAHSRMVFAGNPYLAQRAEAAGAARVELVPTVVDCAAYGLAVRGDGAKPRIGWIGTPNTWAEFGQPMLAMLARVVEEEGAQFRAVGAGAPAEAPAGFEFLDWSEDEEIRLIQGMDIGIMPLPGTPWARGKCGYKLIQYMACGLPVVASPVGVNRDIVEQGVNGFLAESEAEWRDALTRLLRDPELRQRMGAAGRRKVEEHYSLQVYGPKVARLLREAAEAGQRERRRAA